MRDKKVPYLCGGTLFFLLLTARYKKKKARELAQGMADGMADRHIMDGLVYAVTGIHNPSVDSTLKKDTSKYRECDSPGSINIPFHDISTADAYRSAIDIQYDSVFNRMTEFVTSYLDESKYTVFVKYLLEVIEQDDIADTEPLYYSHGSPPATKAILRSMTDFEIQPFLIGIMRFILDSRKDNAGKATLEAWGTREGSNERILTKTDLGESIKRKINVSLAPEIPPATPQEKDGAKKSSYETISEKILESGKVLAEWARNVEDALAEEMLKNEKIEAEVVDDDEPSGAAEDCNQGTDEEKSDSPKIQIVQNPTIYNQHAEKIYNIKHVDHLD